MSMAKGLLISCVVLLGVFSSGLSASIESKLDMKKAIENCEKQSSLTCLKLEFLKLLEKLTERSEINIVPGLSMVKDTNVTLPKNNELIAEIARTFPNDPDQRLNVYIMKKIINFIESRSLRLKLLLSDESLFGETSLTTYGRSDSYYKKSGMDAIIAAGLMMKGTLMAMGMGTVALIAGKALLTGLMALTMTGMIGLKSFTSAGKSSVYEIIAQPVYTASHSHSVGYDDGHHHHHHGGHGHSGYGRSLAFDLPNHLKEP